MKDTLLNIINNDASYNKSATRYLCKTHPDVWSWIISVTSFLPENAKPKQRVWHVINNVSEIPRCPVDGVELKWWENRYLTTSSLSAKVKLQHRRGDFVNGYTPENNEKRRIGNLRAVKNGRKYRSHDTYSDQQRERTKQTWLNKYGVDNPSKTKEVKKKIYQKAIARGCTPVEHRSLRRLYYDAVSQVTKENWTLHFDRINPSRLNRTKYSLDHIYSIQQGFRDNIPPYIIGHWTNLRLIPKAANSAKGMACEKTQEQLFTDFFESIG